MRPDTRMVKMLAKMEAAARFHVGVADLELEYVRIVGLESKEELTLWKRRISMRYRIAGQIRLTMKKASGLKHYNRAGLR